MSKENFTKDIQNVRKYQIEVIELRNTIIELKSTIEGSNSRLDEAEEKKSELRDTVV